MLTFWGYPPNQLTKRVSSSMVDNKKRWKNVQAFQLSNNQTCQPLRLGVVNLTVFQEGHWQLVHHQTCPFLLDDDVILLWLNVTWTTRQNYQAYLQRFARPSWCLQGPNLKWPCACLTCVSIFKGHHSHHSHHNTTFSSQAARLQSLVAEAHVTPMNPPLFLHVQHWTSLDHIFLVASSSTSARARNS